MTLLEHIDAAIAAAQAELDDSMAAVLQQMRRLAVIVPERYTIPAPPAPPAIDPPDPARQLRDNEQLFQPDQPSLPGV